MKNDLKLFRDLLGDRTPTEDDYYTSDEVAAFDTEMMFDYWEKEPTFEQTATVLRLCGESLAFLSAMVDIGSIVETQLV